MTRTDSLLDVQCDLARRVTRLGRDDAELRLGESDGESALRERFRSDRGISASDRLAIYEHAYFARIHEVLKGDHGALHAAIGSDAFHDLVKLYLMAHPSRSFSLRFIGDRLPDFLEGPVGEVFRSRWPFVADLASLERALIDVFDAPDDEALERSSLAQIPPEQWPVLQFALVAAHRLLKLDWPVHTLHAAHLEDEPIPELVELPTRVLVHRRRERVGYRAIDAFEEQALELVRNGADFATLCGFAADLVGDAEGSRRILELLERWMGEGVLANLEVRASSDQSA